MIGRLLVATSEPPSVVREWRRRQSGVTRRLPQKRPDCRTEGAWGTPLKAPATTQTQLPRDWSLKTTTVSLNPQTHAEKSTKNLTQRKIQDGCPALFSFLCARAGLKIGWAEKGQKQGSAYVYVFDVVVLGS